MSLILHAVLRLHVDAAAEPPRPVDCGRLFDWVREGALIGLVSRAGEGMTDAERFADPEAVAALALLHHRTLTELCRLRDVVPVSLGALFSGPEAVRARLHAQASQFAAALDAVGGQAEFALKLIEAAPAAREPPSAQSGRDYLAAMSRRKAGAKADAVARARFATELRQALASGAIPFRERPARPDPARRCLMDLACLAPRGSEAMADMLRESIGPRAAALGLALRIDGPWPPYSFIGEAA